LIRWRLSKIAINLQFLHRKLLPGNMFCLSPSNLSPSSHHYSLPLICGSTQPRRAG
jgi:hypothetical protein